VSNIGLLFQINTMLTIHFILR